MKEKFMAWDPMDPLDLAIMTDESCDALVDEVEESVEDAATSHLLVTEAYETEIGNDPGDNEITADEYDDGVDSCDRASDGVSEDAEDFAAAEMELLAGEFGSDDMSERIDDIEFIGQN